MVNKKKLLNNMGSATVEAAVVIPLLLAVVLLLVFFSVFLYNRAAGVSLTGRAIVLAAGMEQESAVAVEKKMNVFLEDGTKHMPLTGRILVTAEASLLSAKARLELEGANPKLIPSIGGFSFSFQDQRKLQRLDPAKVIWGIRIAKSAGEKEKEAG